MNRGRAMASKQPTRVRINHASRTAASALGHEIMAVPAFRPGRAGPNDQRGHSSGRSHEHRVARTYDAQPVQDVPAPHLARDHSRHHRSRRRVWAAFYYSTKKTVMRIATGPTGSAKIVQVLAKTLAKTTTGCSCSLSPPIGRCQRASLEQRQCRSCHRPDHGRQIAGLARGRHPAAERDRADRASARADAATPAAPSRNCRSRRPPRKGQRKAPKRPRPPSRQRPPKRRRPPRTKDNDSDDDDADDDTDQGQAQQQLRK